MRSRVKNQTTERTVFGLVAWLEQTKISLPLKGVECAFNVCGDVVSVELDQVFQQNSKQALDCLYTFPLPAGAAVYRCEMHVNGRVIRAKVEEQQRARQLAQEKKAEGRRTALVEMERDNLFTLSLGNVQPGDMIVIRFAYFQSLTRLGDWTSFRIPFCPGVRYIPGTPLLRANRGRGAIDDTNQVPDASRISPPRIDRFHPDAAHLTIEGTVEHPLDDLRDLSSPSHPLLVKTAKGSSSITLAERSTVPDSDFIARWTELEVDQAKPSGWLTRRGDESFALLRLRAPKDVATASKYAQDVYFLIDRSGSMQGTKWEKAVEAFRAFLNQLGPEDLVWASFFESHVRDLAEKPLPASAILADAAVQNLERLGTTGGTELLPALEHVLGKMKSHATDRPTSLLLITDGQVGNEAEILKRLGTHSQLRVHVFGIDVTINDGFLQKLAAQHHGTSCLLSPQDDIAGAVARLGDRLRRPVLTEIKVNHGWEIAGQELPDLYAGEILSLPLRHKSPPKSAPSGVGQVVERNISIEAKLSDGTTRSFDFTLAETSAVALSLLWARRRIELLLAKGHNDEAIALAKANNIICEGAAFIAWDEQEKVSVSEQEIYQPSLEPHVLGKAACASGFLSRSRAPRSFLAMGAVTDGTVYEHAYEQHSESPIMAVRDATVERLFEDVASNFHSWRITLEKHPLLKTQPGQALLDCVADWLRSRPRETALCLKKLDELSKTLDSISTGAVSAGEFVVTFRHWMERTLDEPFRQQAQKILNRLEAQTPLPSGT